MAANISAQEGGNSAQLLETSGLFETNAPALDRSFPGVGKVTERRLGAAFGVQPTAFRGAPAQARGEQASVERTG